MIFRAGDFSNWIQHSRLIFTIYDICDTTSYDWFRIAGSKYATSKTGPWTEEFCGRSCFLRFAGLFGHVKGRGLSRIMEPIVVRSLYDGMCTAWASGDTCTENHIDMMAGMTETQLQHGLSTYAQCTAIRLFVFKKKNGPCKTASRPWACCESAWVVALDIPKLSEAYHVWAQHSCAAHPCHVPHTWPSCITIRTADLRAAQYFDWMAMYGAAVRCCDCRCWR